MAGASRKIEMDKKVVQAGRFDNKSTAEERDEFLRALLEAGEESEAEEDDLDDAEALNEAIARSEEERAIFTRMDQARRDGEERAWEAAGNTGKLPERLIQEHELPEVYRIDHEIETAADAVLKEGERRARTAVTYDDGMSEEQWLKTMEEEEEEGEGGGRRRRGAAGGGRKKEVSYEEDSGSDSDAGPSRKRKSGGVEEEGNVSLARPQSC